MGTRITGRIKHVHLNTLKNCAKLSEAPSVVHHLLIQNDKGIGSFIFRLLLSNTGTQKQALSHRGVYFQKFNPPLFAGLSLPHTKIRPKHNGGVV